MGLVLGAVHFGLGRHIQFVSAYAARGVMLLRICEFVLIVSTVFVKISISLFLKRLLYVLDREPCSPFLSLWVYFLT